MRLPNSSLKEFYKKQLKVAIVGLICELPNLIYSIIAACFANSILCWIDSVVSFSSTSHFIIMIFMTSKMVRESGDKYNYGLERLEVFTSFLCDLAISVAMLALIGGSIYGIIIPSNPTDELLWFVLLKGSNFLFDLYFVYKGVKLHKARPTRLTETELAVYLNNTIHDFIVLVTVIICYIFRSHPIAAYLSPIVGIVTICIFLFQYIKHMKGSVKELADVSIPIEDQDNIFDIVLENNQNIKSIKAVNCHRLNNRIHVDLNLVFKDDVTQTQQLEFLENVKLKINEKIPDSVVRLVLENEIEIKEEA